MHCRTLQSAQPLLAVCVAWWARGTHCFLPALTHISGGGPSGTASQAVSVTVDDPGWEDIVQHATRGRTWAQTLPTGLACDGV